MTTPFSVRPDSLETTAPYKFITYSLTYLQLQPKEAQTVQQHILYEY